MTALNPNSKQGQHFTVTDLGSFQDLNQYQFQLQGLPTLEGKVFLNQRLDLTSCEISFNLLPARRKIPFYHKHHLNEEIYLFLQGEGEFQVDGQVFPVKEGTAVRVAPNGERTFRNTTDSNLYFIVIQARANSYEGSTIQDGIGIDKRVSWVNKERI